MRTHRLFVDFELKPNSEFPLSPDRSHYLAKVLRVTVGHPLQLFDGRGEQFDASVSRFEGKAVIVQTSDSTTPGTRSDLFIGLLQAVSRGERMDYSLQKAVELGVSAILPVFSERTEIKLNPQRLQRRTEHWQGVVVSACEQSGRAELPALSPACALQNLKDHDFGNRLKLVANPDAKPALADFDGRQGVWLAIGPEGGFSQADLAQLAEAGFQGFRLGPRTLRSETAGPAAIAACQTLWGDFSS